MDEVAQQKIDAERRALGLDMNDVVVLGPDGKPVPRKIYRATDQSS